MTDGGSGAGTPRRGATAWARAEPERPAVVLGDRRWTYGELDRWARHLAAEVARRGAGPGRPVAAVLPNGAAFFATALGAAMAGAPFLPVNRHLKAAEVAYLLADADAAAVVGTAAGADGLRQALAQVPALDDAALVVVDEAGPPADAGAGDPTLDAGPGPELVFYTSGTTARPKGVVHGGLADPAARAMGMEGQARLWSWTPGDVYVQAGPAYHASHAGWGLTALYCGATTVVLDRFDARGFLDAVAEHRATRSFLVPAHFIRLLEVPDDERDAVDTSSLALVVHAAAPCPVAVKRRMMAAFPHTAVHELYGASEGGATRISPEEWLERPGSVGRPWPGVEITVADETGRVLGPGEDGVVWIRPPGAQRFTYRNDPEATDRAWRDGAFTVGDIGHVDEDGYLTITDRVSDMVLWGGVNIAPREIEETLFEHPAVVDCAVFGVADERDGERLKAMVEVRGDVGTDELADFVRARLADYKVPHHWAVVDELPRDAAGKVRKRLLRQQHEAGGA